jgi:hypothetical protein
MDDADNIFIICIFGIFEDGGMNAKGFLKNQPGFGRGPGGRGQNEQEQKNQRNNAKFCRYRRFHCASFKISVSSGDEFFRR